MGLSTNPALGPACARKCGGFPRSGRGGQRLVWRLPGLWAVLPGTPSPFLPGFLPKPFLETRPTQPPIQGQCFHSGAPGPHRLGGRSLSLSIPSLENSLVVRRTIPWPRTGKSFIITVNLRCLFYFLVELWAPQTGTFSAFSAQSLPGACASLWGNLSLLEREWTRYPDSKYSGSRED